MDHSVHFSKVSPPMSVEFSFESRFIGPPCPVDEKDRFNSEVSEGVNECHKPLFILDNVSAVNVAIRLVVFSLNLGFVKPTQ